MHTACVLEYCVPKKEGKSVSIKKKKYKEMIDYTNVYDLLCWGNLEFAA